MIENEKQRILKDYVTKIENASILIIFAFIKELS